MSYADETSRINDVIRQYREAPTEQLGEAVAENQTQLDATWKEQADEYAHKYSALAEGGGEEIAGALGLEGAYRGYKKLKSLYKDYKDARDKINDNLTKLKNPANKDKLQDPDNVDNNPTEEEPEPSQAPQTAEPSEAQPEPEPEPEAEAEPEPPTDTLTAENIEDIEPEDFDDFLDKALAEGQRATTEIQPSLAPIEEEGADADEVGLARLNRLFQQSEDIERDTNLMRQQRLGEAPSGLDDISVRQAIGAEPLGLDETGLDLEDPYEHQAIKGSEQDDDIQDFYNENDEKYFSGTQEEHDALFNPDGTAKTADINPNLEYLRSKADTGLPEPASDSVFNVGETTSTQEGVVGLARTNNVPIRATEDDMDSTLNDFGIANPKSLYSETRIFAPQNRPLPTSDIDMQNFSSEDFVPPNEPPEQPEPEPEPSVPNEVPEPSVSNPISNSDLTDASTDLRNVLGDSGEPASYMSNVELGDSFLGNLASRGMSRIGSSLAQRGAGIRSAVQNVADRISAPATETLDEDALGDLAKQTAEKVLPEGGEELASFGVGDAVLGAVPVLGEMALGITGLVSVGEGLYHLFHHDAGNPPPAKTPQNIQPANVSNALTTKFAQGLPSVDGASELSGSMVSF
jgi:cell division septation protein DedD